MNRLHPPPGKWLPALAAILAAAAAATPAHASPNFHFAERYGQPAP